MPRLPRNTNRRGRNQDARFVDDKWLAALAASVQGELDLVSQSLTGRIKQLAERYATPLPKLAEEVGDAGSSCGRPPQGDGVRMSAIPAGYKQTEVGTIPKDWDAKPMGTLTSLMTNGFVGTVTNDYVESEDGVLYVQGYNVEENGLISTE